MRPLLAEDFQGRRQAAIQATAWIHAKLQIDIGTKGLVRSQYDGKNPALIMPAIVRHSPRSPPTTPRVPESSQNAVSVVSSTLSGHQSNMR